ncbi:hypothetical protein ANN_23177 [Periplaneta americana]|uniref:Uncharacterized protein n=1 Tax=Periplaneta americana TaxID=6978 RepID=A0ABQ8SLI6_PERAM|nr:hypothetical protein ANN_23177 [Periplaneta americana]
MFAFSSDERAFNIESYFRTDCTLMCCRQYNIHCIMNTYAWTTQFQFSYVIIMRVILHCSADLESKESRKQYNVVCYCDENPSFRITYANILIVDGVNVLTFNEVLPGRWVGRGCPALPDHHEAQTSPHVILVIPMGVHKGYRFTKPYNTTDELKDAVRQAFTQVTPAMLRKMSHRTWWRIILCHENDDEDDGYRKKIEKAKRENSKWGSRHRVTFEDF